MDVFKLFTCRVKKIQLMLNLFLVYFVNLYMFRAYLDPSSRGASVCIQQLVFIILFLKNCLLSCLTKYTKNNLCIKLVFLYAIISRCTVNKT